MDCIVLGRWRGPVGQEQYDAYRLWKRSISAAGAESEEFDTYGRYDIVMFVRGIGERDLIRSLNALRAHMETETLVMIKGESIREAFSDLR
ncbi:hypothetical protein GCM10007108_12870 [Thermogymnomonas acidicola]|uniref:Uncharacterized protein n=1 Tax=Thermogymnomonas acidicola TaxID=399579 RepID=A0AA37FBH3_9ARCH|nr:hypothetical protein [Thermogymnomonas acidicola]GGM76380.1 hypothetical protein GCM10007108_12870 [Thermogymnomonas acidicola]